MEINIKISTKNVFSFLLFHTYTQFSGIFGLILSFGALIILLCTFVNRTPTEKCILILISVLFTVVNPIMLFVKAKQQTMLSQVYKKPLNYIFSSDEITVSQEESSTSVSWDKVIKVRNAGKMLLIYTSKIYAFMIPYSNLENKEELLKIVKEACEKNKINSPKQL